MNWLTAPFRALRWIWLTFFSLAEYEKDPEDYR